MTGGRVEDEIAGFCLVRFYRGEDADINDIGEFFILRKFRSKGLGKQVAHAIFDRYPGKWQVRQMLANRPAQTFWRKVIADYTKAGFVEDRNAQDGIVQRFESPQIS